jgi:UDP-3-O-acyl N-acetylglucosamine deacetylase
MPSINDHQSTITRPVQSEGIALHTGEKVCLKLLPADSCEGIVFYRVDLPGKPAIRVHPGSVCRDSLQRRTELVGENGARVATTEHLLASCMALGIDNLDVELDGPEVPIFDGSALAFTDLLTEAGKTETSRPRPSWKLRNPTGIQRENIEIMAIPAGRMQLVFFAELRHAGLPNQSAELDLTNGRFIDEIAPARTFVFYEELEKLREAGLIRGGSLDCAIVIRDRHPVQTEYRIPNELAAHKLLDFIGDLAILERPVNAIISARGSGHALNFEFIEHLKKELTE